MEDPILGGWQLPPILRYNSGHPFNLLAGADLNGDNNSNTDRPPGASRDSGLGSDYIDIDARLTRRIKFTERVSLQLMAECFKVRLDHHGTTSGNVCGLFFIFAA